MKILHFALVQILATYLPFNYSQLCSLHWHHDNDTTIGWFNQLSDHEKNAFGVICTNLKASIGI